MFSSVAKELYNSFTDEYKNLLRTFKEEEEAHGHVYQDVEDFVAVATTLYLPGHFRAGVWDAAFKASSEEDFIDLAMCTPIVITTKMAMKTVFRTNDPTVVKQASRFVTNVLIEASTGDDYMIALTNAVKLSFFFEFTSFSLRFRQFFFRFRRFSLDFGLFCDFVSFSLDFGVFFRFRRFSSDFVSFSSDFVVFSRIMVFVF
jgi:hypothetical protein